MKPTLQFGSLALLCTLWTCAGCTQKKPLTVSGPHVELMLGIGEESVPENSSLNARSQNNALEQSQNDIILRLEKRLEAAGLDEIVVRKAEQAKIRVQIPAKVDLHRAKKLLLRSGKIEFRLVDDNSLFFANLKDSLPEGIYLENNVRQGRNDAAVMESALLSSGKNEEGKQKILDVLKSATLPDDRDILFSRSGNESRMEYRSFLVWRAPRITGRSIMDARPLKDSETGTYDVSLVFDEDGGKMFEKITQDHMGERLAIVLEDEVMTAPRIMSKISGGRARLTLGRSSSPEEALTEAKDLAAVFRAGPLALSVRLIDEKVVGNVK